MDENKLTDNAEIEIISSNIIQGIIVVQLLALVVSLIMDISQKGSIDMRATKTICITIVINLLLFQSSKLKNSATKR